MQRQRITPAEALAWLKEHPGSTVRQAAEALTGVGRTRTWQRSTVYQAFTHLEDEGKARREKPDEYTKGKGDRWFPVNRRQCDKCPWKVSTNPRDIPHGYCEVKHAALDNTIAAPGSTAKLGADSIRMMACHETPKGAELPCVGWLEHQLGPGNNLQLRLAVINGHVDPHVETVGPQHESLEATLPTEAR